MLMYVALRLTKFIKEILLLSLSLGMTFAGRVQCCSFLWCLDGVDGGARSGIHPAHRKPITKMFSSGTNRGEPIGKPGRSVGNSGCD